MSRSLLYSDVFTCEKNSSHDIPFTFLGVGWVGNTYFSSCLPVE